MTKTIKLNEKIVDILEENGFYLVEITEQGGEYIAEVEMTSPNGEDFVFNIW